MGEKRPAEQVGEQEGIPDLLDLLRAYLKADSALKECASAAAYLPLSVFHSAVASFPIALRDPSLGSRRERIRAKFGVGRTSRYDCAFQVVVTGNEPGMRGIGVVRVKLLFSFYMEKTRTTYPCIVAQWFGKVSGSPDDTTGLYEVKPDKDDMGKAIHQVLSLDCVLRPAHLLPVFPPRTFVDKMQHFSETLDKYGSFYVNK